MLFPSRSGTMSDVATVSWGGSGLQGTVTAEKRSHRRRCSLRSGVAPCALSLWSPPGFVAVSHAATLLIHCSSNRSCPAILLGVTPCTELRAIPTRWLIAALAAARGGSGFASPSVAHALDATLTHPFRTAAWSTTPVLCDTCAPTGDRSSTNITRAFPACFRLFCSFVEK